MPESPLGIPWNETIASKCRYGDCAKYAFEEPVIIYEDSEYDYQGHANILGITKRGNGTIFHYCWSYGSCSGCDSWESLGLTNNQISQLMIEEAAYFHDITILFKYLNIQQDIKTSDCGVKSSWVAKGNETFREMRNAVIDWVKINRSHYAVNKVNFETLKTDT